MKIFNNNKKDYGGYNFIIIIILMVAINTIIILYVMGKKLTPKVYKISSHQVNDFVYKSINTNINNTFFKNKKSVNDILKINKNKNDEIIMVDFYLENAYLIVKELTSNLISSINNDIIVVNVPVGAMFNNVFLNDLGPKIPIKINIVGHALTNLKTKITDYGLNNALVEIYINITINEQILTPVAQDSLKTSYNFLIMSSIINGKVPSFYGGTYEKETRLFDISNEK